MLALFAFLLPSIGPSAAAAGPEPLSPAPFPLVICTADGLVVLHGEDGGSGEPAGDGHDLSCLACLLRLGSPPPGPVGALAPPCLGTAARAAAPMAGEPRSPPRLRPDKTGPPARG